MNVRCECPLLICYCFQYFAISKSNVDEFESSVKEHLKDEFLKNRDNYMIPKNVVNMPGRLKVEYSGTGMIW